MWIFCLGWSERTNNGGKLFSAIWQRQGTNCEYRKARDRAIAAVDIVVGKLYYLATVFMSYFLRVMILFLFLYSGAYGQENNNAGKSGERARKVSIRKIIISGNKVTRSAVIRREIGIHEGDVILADSVTALSYSNKLRLFNLGVFNEVDQRTEEINDEVDWYISVKERWYITPTAILQFADRNINTWWVSEHHDLRRISAGVTVTDKNFRGNLESLSLTAQGGFTQKLGLSYMRPYLNKGQTNGIGFSVAMAQSRKTYYTTDFNKLIFAGAYDGPVILKQLEGGISYLYRPAYAAKHIFQLNYKDYSVGDTVLKLKPDYFEHESTRARFVEFFYRFEYNGVDNWNYSLKGFKLVTTATVRGGLEGIKFQSFANVEAGIFRNPLPKWYTSAILRGRLMVPQDQPYYFRSGLGTQTDYVRGYEYYVIDGGNYGLVRFDLKREIFNNTYSLPVRYFTAVPLRIYPKIFADIGFINSPAPGNSFLSNSLLYSIGAGVDVVTLYDIKIRFEFAYNHMKQNGLYLHFNSE